MLIRDGALLERTFAIHPDYLDSEATRGAGEVNFADRGLQLSRGFRALKVWVTVHTFGLAAFRTVIQRNIELAELTEALIRSKAELTLMAPATLGIVCFRREWPGCDEAETERRGLALADELERSGAAPGSTIRAVQARGVYIDVAAGEEVIRQWDSDRSFYIVVSGRYEVFRDARPVSTLGPGDHFGELAARDWGGGYGYARLATVRCAEPGRLLRLTSEDFQWLVDTDPTVKAELATIVAERLQQR